MTNALFDAPERAVSAWTEAALAGLGLSRPAPRLAPTPRVTLWREGTASLYHFPRPAGTAPSSARVPLLLVPSLINRWYVFDLRPGASVVEALVARGFDVYLLDWGIPEDEDRYLDWDMVLRRLARAVRRTLAAAGAPRLALLGYCLGATLCAIHTALEPGPIAALVNLAGPIDFSRGGALAHLVDRRWFDPDAIAAAGNITGQQMQSGFALLRPTLDLAKLVGKVDLATAAPDAREGFAAVEAWAADNIPFPAAAYRTYLRELYQDNALIAGHHVARGRRVDLAEIRCPLLCIVAERDTICPPGAATPLIDGASSTDAEVLFVPGGHVGAVVGSRAARAMVPALMNWLEPRL